MELFFQRWNLPGPLDREKLVLLHGMGGTGALWRPIGASLEDTLDILAPDQRGHGKSRIPQQTSPQYTPLDYGQDVLDTLNALKFYPTWIVGHSMGVRTAMAAAHLKPEWVKGLILVDLGFTGLAGGGFGEGLAQFLNQLPDRFSSREEAKNFMKTYCPDASIAQYLMAVSISTPEGHQTFPFDHTALIQTIHAARDFSIRPWVRELGNLKKPILVLRGERSGAWSHEEYLQEKEAFLDLVSVQFREISNAGHGLPFEQRPTFVSLIREFMSLTR